MEIPNVWHHVINCHLEDKVVKYTTCQLPANCMTDQLVHIIFFIFLDRASLTVDASHILHLGLQ